MNKEGSRTIEALAQELDAEGLKGWYKIMVLANVFPALEVNDWLDSKEDEDE